MGLCVNESVLLTVARTSVKTNVHTLLHFEIAKQKQKSHNNESNGKLINTLILFHWSHVMYRYRKRVTVLRACVCASANKPYSTKQRVCVCVCVCRDRDREGVCGRACVRVQ